MRNYSSNAYAVMNTLLQCKIEKSSFQCVKGKAMLVHGLNWPVS